MRSTVLLVIVAAACTGEPVEGADETSTTGTAATSSSTSPTTATTMTTTTATTDATTETGEPTTTGEASTADSSSGSSGTPPGACDFETAVDDAIAEAKNLVDCGQLTAADPVGSWDAGRMCARDAALDQAAFELSWQIDDAGTVRDLALATIGMGTPILHLVDDAAVGTSSISLITCTGTFTPSKCTVAVGEPCIACLEPSKPAELCD